MWLVVVVESPGLTPLTKATPSIVILVWMLLMVFVFLVRRSYCCGIHLLYSVYAVILEPQMFK